MKLVMTSIFFQILATWNVKPVRRFRDVAGTAAGSKGKATWSAIVLGLYKLGASVGLAAASEWYSELRKPFGRCLPAD